MTLEDFFTLTEMKDGLTAPSRVEELVAVMQQEKDYVLRNISEATRQWCTVATTLAATENRDCLNLFLQLDGLYFVNKWLKEAQNHGNESNDTFVEESITALLRALEKLGVDDQRSVSSGIFVTVKDLLGHSSTKVNERARSLFDAWRKESNSVELVYDSVPKRSGSEDISVVINDFQDKRVGLQIETSNDATNSRLTSDRVEGETLCAKEETPLAKISSLDLKEANVEHRSGYSNSNEISDDAKQNQKLESSPLVLVREISSTSDALKSRGFTEMGNESMTESALKNVAVFNNAEGYGGNSEHLSNKHEGTGPTLSQTENVSPDVGEAQEHASEESEENSENASVFLKQERGHKDTDEMDELEYGIVDALEVARQVANEVEREVGGRNERSSRSSSSSSKKSLENERQSQPRSPESINGRKRSPNRETAVPNKALDGQDFSTEVSPNGNAEQLITTSDERKLKLENSTRDIESSSQVTEAAQEQEVETVKKEMYGFDLNEEICSEEMERPGNFVSVPIPVVYASRTVATANNLPGNLRQFEGTLGWKGSAATSAFRPASPRRTSDGDKAQGLSVGGIHSCSKQRVDLLNFDLNIVDSAADDKIPDFISGKQILTSGESSIETPRKSEMLKLDLNRVSDESDPPPSDWKTLFHHNGHCSPSPASSSSSMQPSVRNFDLNDRPAFLNESNYQHHQYISKSSSQNHKLNEPVISIMGARVAVNRKDFISQTPSPFLNGIRAHEPAMGGLLGMGPTASYTTHPPVFGYNGITGPTMSFSSNVYGPGTGLGPGHGGLIPCMVDSRGAPVVPQIVGSAPSLPPSPFFMSMSGPSPGLNGPRTMQPSFDLNSGFMIDGGSRDLGSLRQPFVAGPTQLMEEHFRANSNPNSQASSSSGIGGKRKEPDSGWESYPFQYKQHPPWK